MFCTRIRDECAMDEVRCVQLTSFKGFCSLIMSCFMAIMKESMVNVRVRFILIRFCRIAILKRYRSRLIDIPSKNLLCFKPVVPNKHFLRYLKNLVCENLFG